MISIRRIRPGEADLFRQIRLAALLDSPEAFGSTYESALQRSPESWVEQADGSAQASDRATFFAFEGDLPIGIMALYRNEDEAGIRSESGELIQVWVSPQYKGHGVAAAILEVVCVWAGQNDFDKIVAGVAPGNSRALSFYAKHGFEQTSSVAPGESEGLKLVKEIEPSASTQIVFETHSLSEDNRLFRISGG